MPFPVSVSETVIAGGIGPDDITSCAKWLEADLRRSRANSVAVGDRTVRFSSVVTFGGPLWGIGGGVIDLREAGESGKIGVNLSFVPLVILIAAFVTISVASDHASETLVESLMLWVTLFLLMFGPCYLLLPSRFCQFIEESIKRYYQRGSGGIGDLGSETPPAPR